MLKLKNYLKKLLEEISWRTHTWNCSASLFQLLLNQGGVTWGFKALVFTNNYKEYALLSFEFRLPNKTSIKRFTVDHWDVLFLRNTLWEAYDSLSDRALWSGSLSSQDSFKLSILDKLFN